MRVASVNVNGIRAAWRKGMPAWLDAAGADIVTLQEVRASDEILEATLPEGWRFAHDAATAKGRAGVAVLSRVEPLEVRRGLGDGTNDFAGRWLEADFRVGERLLTVVSAYVHSGEADTPKQVEKYAFLDAMTARLPELASHADYALVTGDINVGHRELDIKNWKGNRKKAGFLPEERSYLDGFFGEGDVDAVDGLRRAGLGWVDIGRRHAGEVDGPYTWWSNRGQAFDNDTGWRIDYHIASPTLAPLARDYRVDRYPSYDTRWSDHAPVVADYDL